jgi:hypothetical protein
VRVARSGYPVRLPHSEFYARYRCLATAPAPTPASTPTNTSSSSSDGGGGGSGSSKGKKKEAFPYHVEDVGAEASRGWCQRVLDAVLTLQVGVRGRM